MQPFWPAIAATIFNYVDWHRERSTTELGTEFEALARRKRLGKRMKSDEKVVSTLPGNEGMMGQ